MVMTLHFRVLRKRAHVTMQEMADCCGVNMNTWSIWEKDPSKMTHGEYCKSLDYLEWSIHIRKVVEMLREDDAQLTRGEAARLKLLEQTLREQREKSQQRDTWTETQLRELRMAVNIRQESMAELFDVTTTTWRRWENDCDNMPHDAYCTCLEYYQQVMRVRERANDITERSEQSAKYYAALDAKETRLRQEKDKQASSLKAIEDMGITIPPIIQQYGYEFTGCDPSTGGPVSRRAREAFENKGKEPYPGYFSEWLEWNKAWEDLDRTIDEHKFGKPADGYDPDIDDIENRIIYDEYGNPEAYYDDEGNLVDIEDIISPTAPVSFEEHFPQESLQEMAQWRMEHTGSDDDEDELRDLVVDPYASDDDDDDEYDELRNLAVDPYAPDDE